MLFGFFMKLTGPFFVGDGRNGDSSLVVSLEINGTTFQGVLFAQPGKHRTTTSS